MRGKRYLTPFPQDFLFASLRRVGWGPLFSILAHRAVGWLGEIHRGVFSCGMQYKINDKKTADFADYADKGT